MPFTALYRDDTINSLLLEPEEWNDLKTSEKECRELRCPECEEPMIARASRHHKVSPHFAHRYDLIENPEGHRKYCSLKSESAEHLYIKQWIFQICQSHGLAVEIEKRIPVNGGIQIADVCVPEKKKIVEVQVSTQPEERYFERSEQYSEACYETLWITWKKDIPILPSARISIRSRGKLLKNKKNITTADQFWLLTPALYFRENKDLRRFNYNSEDMWDYDIDTIDESVSLDTLICTFMFDIARYEKSCSVCHKPHWCGKRCVEAKPRMEAIIIGRRRNYIGYLRRDYPGVYEFVSKRYSPELKAYLKGEETDIRDLIDRLIAEEEDKQVRISVHRIVVEDFELTNPRAYAYLKRKYRSQLKSYLDGEDNGIDQIIDEIGREETHRKQVEEHKEKKENLIQQHDAIVEQVLKTHISPLPEELAEESVIESVRYMANFQIQHDLSAYTKEDYIKHFNGEKYDYDIELALKYTYRDVYQAARIAHENRMLGLHRDIPPLCQAFLNTSIELK